ncbi:hypothetical protein MKUB_07680 [Mycobacterium kubicae]|uniref:Type II toxin-antitoxin system VapB family antitoxin n=1 Tax=Mycobacterium kubicae TaxID=120959 RepID=A0AAX1JER4_9MYCO|nr:type II toxin-antitoxin system VapB family antitoxin [Mycobacterium kubicae]MCV7098654.1 type II toxin-antitoxin system VapB family antitoxin [Mycobacterium kubicae]OBF24228.1 hypothetical protein A5725_06260 [Mycobacterium kubicae]ORW04969.1 hypothetical protein AWC13_26950 [Mycobacterium kubicae]QNI05652.1 type II toxin-antitoxin system VapB family antitoxin [Mycobacterium kubicae]QNI10648.1 type II toxin-antitoxin system VapB family antitoxin [Mycobacterium kubicae]
MRKRVEFEVETDLVDEVIRRFHLADTREAVHLALKALIDQTEDPEHPSDEDEYDEFSDLNAWVPRRDEDAK